jgi:hypothetical protein
MMDVKKQVVTEFVKKIFLYTQRHDLYYVTTIYNYDIFHPALWKIGYGSG